jgi:hypothetical protein
VLSVRIVLALVVLVASLSGCSGGGAGGDDPEGTGGTGGHGAHGELDPSTHILAPTWEVGQWWTWTAETGDGPEPFSYVVSKDGGQDWILDTDSPDIAFFNAREDISFLGQMRKSDLAGSQGSTRVEFFQFPLTQDRNWTTTWDGLSVTIRVTAVEDGVADLEARRENGTLHARYTFDSETGYFGEVTFYGPDGASTQFATAVTDSGKAFAGDLVRWELAVLYESSGPLTPGARSFQVGPGLTDVWANVALSCDVGAVTLNFGPFTGPAEERGFSANGPCPLALVEQFTISAPAADEAWGVQEGTTPTTQSALDLTILARTQTLFKAGAAP